MKTEKLYDLEILCVVYLTPKLGPHVLIMSDERE